MASNVKSARNKGSFLKGFDQNGTPVSYNTRDLGWTKIHGDIGKTTIVRSPSVVRVGQANIAIRTEDGQTLNMGAADFLKMAHAVAAGEVAGITPDDFNL